MPTDRALMGSRNASCLVQSPSPPLQSARLVCLDKTKQCPDRVAQQDGINWSRVSISENYQQNTKQPTTIQWFFFTSPVYTNDNVIGPMIGKLSQVRDKVLISSPQEYHIVAGCWVVYVKYTVYYTPQTTKTDLNYRLNLTSC